MRKTKTVTERKANYWRGFRASLVITLPIIITLVIIINKLLTITQSL